MIEFQVLDSIPYGRVKSIHLLGKGKTKTKTKLMLENY